MTPEPQPQALHPWPNEVSIAINLSEKLQETLMDENGDQLHSIESVLELDEIYQAAPSLEQIVRDAIDGRRIPDYAYEFLDREENDVARLVFEQLPAEQLKSLTEAMRMRAVEEATNSA